MPRPPVPPTSALHNPSTRLLPSWKCTQAVVTATICVSWWIIKVLAAVHSHANMRSAISLRERRWLSRNAIFIMSRQLAEARSVQLGRLWVGGWGSDAGKEEKKNNNCMEPWWMACETLGDVFFFSFLSGKTHFLQRQFQAALDAIKGTKCSQRCRRSL